MLKFELRALLRWRISDLAKHAGISVPTVQAIELPDGEPVVTGGLPETRDYRQEARAGSVKKVLHAF